MNKELWLNFENSLLNKGVTKKRINKLKVMFNLVTKHINLEKAKRPEIEAYINKLHRNDLKKQNGQNFSGSSKSDIKKFIKQFYKYYRGNDEHYPIEVSWIRTNISKDERPEEKTVITEQEAVKLASHFKKPEFRILTLLLFDSGFRISEMLGIRKKDLTFEKLDDDDNKCFWVYCKESKTLPRKVPIQLFTEDIKTFINSAYFRSLNNEDTVFNVLYQSYLKSLSLASQKVIGKHLSPHSLRHSSATLYARLYDGNSMMLADRYGWSYSSKELKTYIRRSGAFQRIGAKKVFSTELIKLKEENKKLNDRLNKLEKATSILLKLNKKK